MKNFQNRIDLVEGWSEFWHTSPFTNMSLIRHISRLPPGQYICELGRISACRESSQALSDSRYCSHSSLKKTHFQLIPLLTGISKICIIMASTCLSDLFYFFIGTWLEEAGMFYIKTWSSPRLGKISSTAESLDVMLK